MNKIVTLQKFIKIGDSNGVTVPAKDFKLSGFKTGDAVKVTFEAVETPEQHTEEVVALAQKLIKRHEKALKKLSQR